MTELCWKLRLLKCVLFKREFTLVRLKYEMIIWFVVCKTQSRTHFFLVGEMLLQIIWTSHKLQNIIYKAFGRRIIDSVLGRGSKLKYFFSKENCFTENRIKFFFYNASYKFWSRIESPIDKISVSLFSIRVQSS